MDDAHLNQALKALADRKRFRILREVAAAGELTCGEVGDLLPLSQPTVSHHIHVLVEAGLLSVRRTGQQGLVSVNREALEVVPRLLMERIFGPAPDPARLPPIRLVRSFDAPPERVFDAWIDADSIAAWMFPRLSEVVEGVDITPRPGGALSIRVRHGKELVEYAGEYLEFARPERLVFTWCLPAAEARSQVTVDFEATAGGCEVSVEHALDPDWADEAARVEGIWVLALDGLAELLA